MSGIQRKLVLFVIAITFWGNHAHATETIGNSSVAIQTTVDNSNTTKPRCSERSLEYKHAGFAANNAFNDLVTFTINNSSMDNTPYMTAYNQSLTTFLETSFKYCTTNQTITTESFTDYLKTLAFSLRNVTVLKDLEKNGGFKCILAQKPKIDTCLQEKIDQNITLHNNYSILHSKSHLSFNSLNCGRTNNVKTCVLEVLKEDNTCDKASEYVSSIFDFVTSNYCKTDSNNASIKSTAHWSFFIIFSLWSALVLNRSYFN